MISGTSMNLVQISSTFVSGASVIDESLVIVDIMPYLHCVMFPWIVSVSLGKNRRTKSDVSTEKDVKFPFAIDNM